MFMLHARRCPMLLTLLCGTAGTVATGCPGTVSGSDATPGTDASASSDTGTTDAGSPDAAAGTDAAPTATRYDDTSLRSPTTGEVAARLADIAANDSGRADDVFMKVGASGTVSPHLLHCFAEGGSYVLDWDGRDYLDPTRAWFLAGDAAGANPYERITLAAEVGRSVSWAIGGTPSPLDQEIAALNPRFAFVNYGTNDMQLGITHETALFPFFENMSALLDQLEAAGIIPIITGLNPRSDTATAADWVPTYNTVTRGMAEARRLPWINLYEAARVLPDLGLVADGIHGNAYSAGGAQPCVFNTDGLMFNYNIRNLLSMEALDVTRRVLLLGDVAPDAPVAAIPGTGTLSDPWEVDVLPFTHTADTASSTDATIDDYPACDTGQDESGPEYVYRLDLTSPTPLRFVVLDLPGVDVDLHLLGSSADPATCTERHDRILEGTYGPGTVHLVVDTFVPADGIPRSGEYLLVVQPCEPGDPDC